VAEVTTIVPSGSGALGFTLGHASITGPVYGYEPLLAVASSLLPSARIEVKRKSNRELVVSLVLLAAET